MNLPLVDLLVFVAYLVGVTAFGCSFYFRRGAADAADTFTSGGGRLPAWAVGMSIFATFVSSISFLGLPAKAYVGNWNAFVFVCRFWASWMAVVFAALLQPNSASPTVIWRRASGPGASTPRSVIWSRRSRGWARSSSIGAADECATGVVGANADRCDGGHAALLRDGRHQAVIWTDAVGIILIGGTLLCRRCCSSQCRRVRQAWTLAVSEAR